jgi:hypothetical protein
MDVENRSPERHPAHRIRVTFRNRRHRYRWRPLIYDWKNRYATHQPVLLAAVQATEGAIVEFGCGHGSTPLLHRLAVLDRRRLITLDTNEQWLARFRSQFESPWHEFHAVSQWGEALASLDWDASWSVVFVDQDAWDARAATVRRFRDLAEYVVVHDCDYFPREGLFGSELAPLKGPADRGARDYSDVFLSWRELFPPEPWPYRPTGPPTLVGSNVHDVHALRIDYDLPLYWRLGRYLRAFVPAQVRLKIANAIDWGTSRYAE